MIEGESFAELSFAAADLLFRGYYGEPPGAKRKKGTEPRAKRKKGTEPRAKQSDV